MVYLQTSSSYVLLTVIRMLPHTHLAPDVGVQLVVWGMGGRRGK